MIIPGADFIYFYSLLPDKIQNCKNYKTIFSIVLAIFGHALRLRLKLSIFFQKMKSKFLKPYSYRIPNCLRSWALCRSSTSETIHVYNFFVTNYHVPFHLCKRQIWLNIRNLQSVMTAVVDFRNSTHSWWCFFLQKYFVLINFFL